MLLKFCQLSLAAVLVLICGCALPVDQSARPSFVPKEELLLVQLMREGMAYFNQSRFIDAELRFRQVLWLRPELENAQVNLARTLEAVGLAMESVKQYDQLIEKFPEKIEYKLGRARALLVAGRRREALKAIEEVSIEYLSKNQDGLAANTARSLSNLYFKYGSEEQAFCFSSQAFAIRADRGEAQAHGRIMIALGSFDRAEEFLTAFSTQNGLDKDPIFLAMRALSSYGLNERKLARSLAELALLSLGLDPDYNFQVKLIYYMEELKALEAEASPDDVEDIGLAGLLKQLHESEGTLSASALYWPAVLVEEVASLY
ncbi:MAG: hypothetical protein DCC75_12515 [Proteobacteria bacterium]|nr:MAG: hypothetical protein DCC75_12515 [Pseudomonadota bacterium]